MKFGLSREDVGERRGKKKWQVCLEGRVCPAVYFQPCWVGATGFTALC